MSAELAREAALAIERGELGVAVEHLATLEKSDPANPAWPRRLGDVCRRLGRLADAAEALGRAADLYAARGDPLKAAALAKEALLLDPNDTHARRRLTQLTPSVPIVRGEPVIAPPLPKVAPSKAPAQPLEAAQIHCMVPGAQPREDDDALDAEIIYEIPLDDAIEEALAEAPAPARAARSSLVARETMPKTPLFASLSAQSFLQIVQGARLIELGPGEVVFRQGDPGDALYVVAEGEVSVVAESGAELSRLGEGAMFGEMALITDEPRSATVKASSETRLLAIDRALVHQVLERDGWAITVLLKFLRDRFVARLVKMHPLFARVPEEDRPAIARRARFVEIERGSALIRQGEGPKALFIVVAGRVEITRKEDGRVVPLATLKPGDLCGEMSLLSRQPAVATARASTKTFAIELPAGAFYQLVGLHGGALDFVKALAEKRRASIEVSGEGSLDLV